MNGDIVIQNLLITRKGQHEYFQLNIARDVTAITGIASSVQLQEVVPVNGTGQTGMLQLQATGTANGCYNSIVKLEAAAALKGDLGLSVYQAGFTQDNALLTNGLAMRGKSSAETIHLLPCNSFYGNYRDLLGARLGRDVQYRVSITLFTTKRKL